MIAPQYTAEDAAGRGRAPRRLAPREAHRRLSVSNSLSGRHWELDQVPAVGDPTDIVQFGTGHHVAAGKGQRRVALQRRVAAYLVVGGLEVGKFPFKITGMPEQHLVETFSPRRSEALLHESSRARTRLTDRILTCQCETTLVGRGRSSD